MSIYNKILIIALFLVIALAPQLLALDLVNTVLSDVWDSTGQSIRISYVASESGWDVAEETALTNTVHPLVTFTHTTSDTPAAGIGLSLDWYQETAAANTELGARIAVVTSDVTAASEDFGINWMLMAAGVAPATKMSLGSTGVLTLVNGATLDNATNGTLTITEPAIAIAGTLATTGAVDFGGTITQANDEIITNAVNGTVQIQSTTALTNTVSPEFSLLHETSGEPANNIGTGITFVQESSAGNNETGMSLDTIVTDVTAASEDFKFSVSLMAAGAAKAEKFAVQSTGVVTLVNSAMIDNSADGTVVVTEPTISLQGAIDYKVCNMTKDDATPDVTGCYIMQTVANDGALEITDLDNPVVGSIVILVGTSATNAPTITDGGNFALSAGWTGSVDETLTLYVQADNDYIELTRSAN